MSHTSYLEKDRRGSYVGTIETDWKIEEKIALQKGCTFVMWPMGSAKKNPKLLELVPPGRNIVTEAIILVKMHRTRDGRNRYFGQRKVDLKVGGHPVVTMKACFTLFENEENFGLVVS